MKRSEDWPKKLGDYLLANKAVRFSWDSRTGLDCALFACGAIAAMAGVDPAVDFRGKYTTQAGAIAAVKAKGATSNEELFVKIATEQNMPEISIKLAQRGDVVLLDGKEGPALGVVDLTGRDAVFVGQDGLSRIPVLSVRRAWKVG